MQAFDVLRLILFMPRYINYNAKFFEEGTPIIKADSRGLRYGDGLFETMKVVNGEISLANFHFERLFQGLHLLHFKIPSHFTETFLREQVAALCRKNKMSKPLRIRLNVFRKNGGLYDPVDHIPDF